MVSMSLQRPASTLAPIARAAAAVVNFCSKWIGYRRRFVSPVHCALRTLLVWTPSGDGRPMTESSALDRQGFADALVKLRFDVLEIARVAIRADGGVVPLRRLWT